MKISVITVVFNGAGTIADCLASVARQTHPDVEHIVIDGGSQDGTVGIVRANAAGITKFVSEPDQGIYDAMNKGLALATGEAIGILNSDDIYADEKVLADVARRLEDSGADSCYGDLVYVRKRDTNDVVRYWKAGDYRRENFRNGWMPPHTACFIRKALYDRHGNFNLSYRIAADYDLLLRFLYKHGISSAYIPRVLVKMRVGGHSAGTVKSIVINNLECYQAWERNGLRINPFRMLLKPLSKILQLRRLP